ncbi:Winged helix-turn-helix transcription repressor DNA-binding [Penicillium verhagenii]|uniref:Winged helix-turn-helix transcription repressor DNA-binding n=1 Tax=Penicillium verhagenii TaxID=1562060 RepID=UPI002544E483|nr:Winged helix-turn-helix transcription repressor DNA-binding [Penicillium verhagenii]KAJ5939517.1 Winged helix-turn-helix transcription repressor DNA-binding [Penicillium verhagenii]
MPTFSYAQAAKGVSDSPAPATPVSTEPEKIESKHEETNEVPTEPVTTTSETETPQEAEVTTSNVDEDAEFTTVTNKHASRSKAVHSRTSSPSVRSAATQSKEVESSNTSNGTQEVSSEKQAQSDAKTEKAENDAEESKDKSGKTEKSDKTDKAEKSTSPKELKAAPLPSVNIWLQRKEAQDAKVKTSPPPTAGKASLAKATEESQQDSPKTNSKKKGSESPQEGTKGGKKSDAAKGRDGALPSVEDATSWPTPQVATGEDKKKSEKSEKSEKSPVQRSHGKEKWMPVNYVPTAVFNTPLPSAGRGGRKATRGGRDGGRGASHANGAATGEKATQGQSAPNSGGKQVSAERGRNEAGTGRAASVPAQNRRSANSDVTTPEGHKTQAAERNNNNNHRHQRAAEDAAVPNGKQVNGGGDVARPQRDGKQFNRNNNNNEARNAKGGQLAVDSQAAARANERRFDSGSKSADVNREVGAGAFQDFHRDSRADRGGRGSNRGRGGAYSGFNGHNGHFNPGNNFVPKSFGYNDRQRSQHGLANGAQQGNRMPLRSPSMTANANPYGVYPYQSDVNNMYPYQQVNPGPMNAMPYQPYPETPSLVTMLSLQLEYYFSVDNMCKDMFLRKQMDSEGFVPLNVIANFKRVQSLTEDFDLLRQVSRQLRTVQHQIGEDGVDRLRPREKWAQWVLSDAPPALPAKNDENTPFNSHFDSPSNGFINPGSQQFVPNGTASYNPGTALSSTAPEFQPSGQNEVATVGPPQDFFCFPPLDGLEMDPFSHMATQLDKTFIDQPKSARGLDPKTEPYYPSELATQRAGDQGGSYESYHSHNILGTEIDQSPEVQNSKSFEWKRRHNYSERSRHRLARSYNEFQNQDFESSEHRPFNRNLASPAGYQYMLDRLEKVFDEKMYNEFRRHALDDLLTRQNRYGFNCLLEFFRLSLTPDFPLHHIVLSDLIGLCHDESFKPRDVIFGFARDAVHHDDTPHQKSRRIHTTFTREFGRQWLRPWKAPFN